MSTLRHENRHVEQLYEISPLYPEETLFRRITHALGHQPGDLMETDAHLLTILDADADYESVTSHIAHFLLKDGYWRGAIKTVEELKGLGYVEVAEQLREYLLNYYERIPWNDLKVEDAEGYIVRP